MSLQNLSDYRPGFPQPDVPASGNYTGTFGKEQQYYGNTSDSTGTAAAGDAAAGDAATGEKTYSSGKYTFNPKTGKYTWVPTTATTTPVTTDTTTKKADVVEGPGGGQDRIADTTDTTSADNLGGIPGATNINGVSGPTTGLASIANSLAATLGNMGLTSISDAIAKNVDPNYSHEGRNSNSVNVDSQAALADAMANAISGADIASGVDPGTGLQGQGTTGQTGLYGDADAGYGAVDPGTGLQGQGDDGQTGLYGDAFAGTTAAPAPAAVDNDAALAEAFADMLSGTTTTTADTAPAAPTATADVAAAAAAADSSGGDAAADSGGGGGDAGGGGGDAGGGGGDAGGGGPQARGGVVGRFAYGGLGSLGGYSDGGRLLRGPGDGVSDSIPATIGKAKQPARLADGEFVVPARIVSELGNGSTEAGARKLYAMLARIQAGRAKSMGKNNVATNSRMDKHLPA